MAASNDPHAVLKRERHHFMIIGVLKEIMDSENRVAATPAVVQELCKHGHQVLVEAGAGLGSGITDQEYVAAGAKLTDAAGAWAGDLILKVKEPLPPEYGYFQPGKMLFTYLHLAASPELTKALMRTGMLAIGYETVQLSNGYLPLLVPMSEVAGRMAVQIGARYLEKAEGGRGVLLGGVPGVPPAEVVIIGGGAVGSNAARIALGLGAHVSILDRNIARLRYLTEVFPGNLTTIMSNTYNIERAVANADLLIGAVLIPGAKTPKLVEERMVATMRPGSVIVDVAVDQGGCIETVDRVTTHSNPIYIKHNVIHYAVGNMPGAVPRTSTFALTNATHPYVMALADHGMDAIKADPALAKGVNVANGAVVYQAVAEAHNLPYTSLDEVLK